MSVPVLTAVTGTSWEAQLVAALERTPTGISVVRRCVDLPDLLATAATGTARAALLSAELHRLDRDALSRLAAARVVVVGLHGPGDEAAELRLRQLGLAHVLPADAAPPDIAAAVVAALQAQEQVGSGQAYSQPLRTLPDLPAPSETALDPGPPLSTEAGVKPGAGRLVAVWGPTGAPGRTTVAIGVASALGQAGIRALLADADVYGGVIAQVLGLLDEAPGLAAAARAANNGTLDVAGLARAAPLVAPNLRVLTGISRADRWPELAPAAVEQVWELARSLAPVTVVDCGFCLEQDEELSYDTAAPRRNGVTLVTLARADVVLAVGAADPIGVQRLVRGLDQLQEVIPDAAPRTVLNRVRRSAIGADPHHQLGEALERYARVRDVTFLPEDREALDAALLQGRAVGEAAPTSPLAVALAGLAASVAGVPTPRRRRGLLRRGA